MTRTFRACLAAGALLTVTACQLPTGDSTVAPTGTTPTPPAVAELDIRVEDTGHHFDRDNWPHWSYHGDGCDTREVVMRERVLRDFLLGKGCKSLEGVWLSRYDGVLLRATRPDGDTEWSESADGGHTWNEGDTPDLDHVVPLSEAARSGTRDWTHHTRERFANDRANLALMTASSNRSKGDQDPAEWLPDLDQCGYVETWVKVKAKYELTADPAEVAAIEDVLRSC